MRYKIEKLCPRDVDGYDRFLPYSRGVYEQGYLKLGAVAFLDFASMVRAAPALMKYRAWRSVYGVVSSYVRADRSEERRVGKECVSTCRFWSWQDLSIKNNRLYRVQCTNEQQQQRT